MPVAVFLVFSAGPSYATDQTACGTLSSADTYVLTQDVAAAGTCFTISAAGITLDCNGHLINYSQSSSSTYGVLVNGDSADSFIIKNCRIMKGSTSTTSTEGIRVGGGDAGLIQNNTVITDGGTTEDLNFGIVLRPGSSDNLVYNNTVITQGDDFNIGIYISNAARNNVTNNIVNTGNTDDDNYGIYVFVSDSNGIFNNTVITSVESSDSDNYGIYIDTSSDFNLAENNSVTTFGSSSHGIYVAGASAAAKGAGNNITENVIVTSGSTAHGIYSARHANSTVSNNTITTSGSSSSGINVDNSSRVAFINNTIKTTASGSYGFRLNGVTSESLIYNNFINTTDLSVFISSAGYNEWNTTPAALDNIAGGLNMGGNLYLNTSASGGFGRSCADADLDTVCDANFTHGVDNADFLPLVFIDNNIILTSPSFEKVAATVGMRLVFHIGRSKTNSIIAAEDRYTTVYRDGVTAALVSAGGTVGSKIDKGFSSSDMSLEMRETRDNAIIMAFVNGTNSTILSVLDSFGKGKMPPRAFSPWSYFAPAEFPVHVRLEYGDADITGNGRIPASGVSLLVSNEGKNARGLPSISVKVM